MTNWSNFFEGELGAAAALAGLLFVALSVNQERILAFGRIADRGGEALVTLFLVLVVASLPLIPGQPIRLLGGEIAIIAVATLAAIVPVQLGHLGSLEYQYRRRALFIVWLNRLAIGIIALSGLLILGRGDTMGLYVLPPGIFLSFAATGVNAWVLLIEINR